MAIEDDEGELEHVLITALEKRFAAPMPKDRSGLDAAYADAMRQAYARFPDDPDVCALTGEAGYLSEFRGCVCFDARAER